MQSPPSGEPDLDRTDALPVLSLDAGDTGTLAMPHLPGTRLPRRLRVADEAFSSTDSFTSATLAGPMPAIPASVPDLAESLREREGRLAEAARREQELQAQLTQASRQVQEREVQLAQADRLNTELQSQLEQSRQLSAELRSRMEQSERRCAELQSQVEYLSRRCAELESDPGPDTPAGLIEELDALRRTNGLLYESISLMNGRLGVQEAMLAEAEEALEGGASGGPLQVDWAARYAELELMLEGERQAAAAQLAALRAQLAAPSAAGSREAAPTAGDGAPARVLVRIEGGTETIHPLGRRTTIGRTPDNDIQVDTTYVSRHHAVLLSSAGECIVEDLNSTNGLLVNGERAGRRILQHGDLLVVGKTRFRYESRE